MLIELRTALDLIEATATIDKGRIYGIRYVKEDGQIKEMLVSKKPTRPRKASTKTKRYTSPNMKNRALIPIIDHTEGNQFKSIIMWGIIAFNESGDLKNWARIKRG